MTNSSGAPMRTRKESTDVVVFWVAASLLAFGAMLLIAWPLLSTIASRPADEASEEDRLEAELSALTRELEFGLIEADAAATADAEARRRASRAADVGAGGTKFRTGRMAAIGALGLAPLAAGLLYVNIGAPEVFDAVKRASSEDQPIASMAEGDTSALEARVKSSPEDFESWMALGDAYAAVNRAADAVRAFGRAAALRPDDAAAQSSLGEALVFSSSGAITEEARLAFERALALAAGDPRARFYLAEARYQVGAIDEALHGWATLLNDAAMDAPWFAAVAGRMKAAAEEANISLASLKIDEATLQRIEAISEAEAVETPAPNAADAIAAMPEEERRQMIEGMVAGLAERLKESPDDPDGWRRLARSYRVLERPSDSVDSWREFLKRGVPDVEDWRQFAFALIEARPAGDDAISAELENALLKIQDFQPEDPIALYQLGHAARNRGDKKEAIALWTRLQSVMPPDTPFAATLATLIEETK
jgi:cytochrome c-type biogenesis protein CcmH